MICEWAVERISENVHRINVDAPNFRANGNRFSILLQADQHIDSPHTDGQRPMMKRHLQQALDIGAPVVGLGDLFDGMQGRHDPRRANADVRPEYAQREDYYDAIVQDAVDFHAPFASQMALYARGNHETSVLKNANTDLLTRWAYRLGSETGSHPMIGGYGGWLIVRFIEKNKTTTQSVRIKYFHGSGGGGVVTKGVLQNVRRAAIFPDADVVISGHIHEDWRMTLSRERVTQHGGILLDEQLHICVPSYKEEYGKGSGGWHVERGAPPKPVGATWLHIEPMSEQVSKNKNRYRLRVHDEMAR